MGGELGGRDPLRGLGATHMWVSDGQVSFLAKPPSEAHVVLETAPEVVAQLPPRVEGPSRNAPPERQEVTSNVSVACHYFGVTRGPERWPRGRALGRLAPPPSSKGRACDSGPADDA